MKKEEKCWRLRECAGEKLAGALNDKKDNVELELSITKGNYY
jgi:hypothetical protein